MAEKAMSQVRETIEEILASRFPSEAAAELAKILSSGYWTHDYPITCERLIKMGIKVKCNLDPAVYRFMELYPQRGYRRPSVQNLPVPYKQGDGRD